MHTELLIKINIILLMFLTVFLLYLVCKYLHIEIRLIFPANEKNAALLISVIFLPIVVLVWLLAITSFSNSLSLSITLISIVSLVVYFFVTLFIIKLVYSLYNTRKKLEGVRLHNKSLKELHDNVRGFKHDFGNIVQAIGGYVNHSDLEGLKTYYSQLLGDCQKINTLSALNPDVINNPAIYSIISSKYQNAEKLGISINLNVFMNLNDLNIKIYEFSRILGILLDNAIEAAKECDEKMINIEIRKDSQRNRQLLLIENTYSEKNVDLEHIFQKGVSSKPNNTGLGLWEVRKILKKYKNLNLFTNKDNKFFKQQLEMYAN